MNNLSVSKALLSLYPDLPLNIDVAVAKKVCDERCFTEQKEALDDLPPEASLIDFLSKFRHDSSSEEFLWLYIEGMTNEKDVHKKMY